MKLDVGAIIFVLKKKSLQIIRSSKFSYHNSLMGWCCIQLKCRLGCIIRFQLIMFNRDFESSDSGVE